MTVDGALSAESGTSGALGCLPAIGVRVPAWTNWQLSPSSPASSTARALQRRRAALRPRRRIVSRARHQGRNHRRRPRPRAVPIARRYAESGCRTIVAAGGDGTVSAVASALVGTQAALGVLPLGTLNHFAKDVGIPLDLDAAVETIINGRERAGRRRRGQRPHLHQQFEHRPLSGHRAGALRAPAPRREQVARLRPRAATP